MGMIKNQTSNLNNAFWITINLILLLIALIIPLSLNSIFDGLPFSGRSELIVVIVVIPILILVGRKFLGIPWLIIPLITIICVRVCVLALAPTEGLGIRIYEDQDSLKRGQWEKTYQTLWRPGLSDLMRSPYLHVTDFPLEWLNRYDDDKSRNSARILLELNGWVRIPKGKTLAFIIEGSIKKNLSAGKETLPIFSSRSEASKYKHTNNISQVLQVKGVIQYQSITRQNWKLMPILIGHNGQMSEAFSEHAFWVTSDVKSIDSTVLRLLLAVSAATDIFIAAFIIFWTCLSIYNLIKGKIIDIGVTVCAAGGIVAPWLMPLLGVRQVHYLGYGIGLTAMMLIGWVIYKSIKDKIWIHNIGLVVLLSLGPGIFFHYLDLWWYEAPRLTFFAVGNDYLTYQRFAQKIVLENDWLQFNQNPIFTYQPLYRYIAALLHILFGQSALAQKMLDVWSVVGAAGILAVMARRYHLLPFWCVMVPSVFLWHLLNDRFLFMIGMGLQEYLAMFMMMIAAWAMGEREINKPSVWRPGVFCVLAFLLRMDHAVGLAAMALLAFQPISGSFLKAWSRLIKTVVSNWRWIAAYVLIIIGGILIVCVRNWVGGNEFVLTKNSNLAYLKINNLGEMIESLGLLINAHEKTIGLGGRVIWIGVIAGMAGMFCRFGFLRSYPLELSIIILGIIAPYFYLKVNAYTPRFSIHLLPFASLSAIILLSSMFADFSRYLQSRLTRNRNYGGKPK
jgi:hypothetical protein